MKPIGVLFNPISGRGRGPRIAVGAAERIIAGGMSAELHESKSEYEGDEAEAMLDRFSALLIVGGDGTLRPLLPSLAAAKLPVYMFPAGNESLFANHFSMRRSVSRLLALVKRNEPSEHYFGLVDGQPFFSMVSVGLDSCVVEMLARSRTGAVGHRGYILPTLHCLRTYRPPRIRLESDGRTLVDSEPGCVIVANSPAYARGLNPVPGAQSSENMLYAAFYPHTSAKFYLSWILPLIRRQAYHHPERKLFAEKVFKISTGDESFPVQADGEHIGRTPVHIVLSAARILVL